MANAFEFSGLTIRFFFAVRQEVTKTDKFRSSSSKNLIKTVLALNIRLPTVVNVCWLSK